MCPAIRIKDVARRAGLSSATVSRVLAGKPHISDSARQRVLAAVSELEYQPSRVARTLRVQTSRIIGLIVSDVENPFFTSLARAVEDAAYENGYALFLCNSDENSDKERLYVDLMYAERVAGVVLVPTCDVDNPCRKLIDAGIPVVAVDRRIADLALDTVVIDNAAAACEVVSRLIQDGHRRIGCLVGPPATSTGRERRDGYAQAMAEHGLPVEADLIRTGLPKEDAGYRLAQELLDLPQPPTALFTGNNLLTLGALRAFDERGLHVPRDIALGAFDDVPQAFHAGLALIVARQPARDIGWTAAELLLKRMADKARPTETVVHRAKVDRTGGAWMAPSV